MAGLYKKYALCLLIFLMMVTASSSCFFETEAPQEKEKKITDRYTDVSDADWFADAVEHACGLRLMTGTSENTFEPKAGMTRAMFVQALYMMSGQIPDEPSSGLPFKDVSSADPYYDAVNWAYKRHIMSGSTENLFQPSSVMTREQAVQLFYRYSGEPPAGSGNLSGFADKDAVESWARKAYVWAVKEGLISGTLVDGKMYLNPRKDLKRGEAAVLLTDFYSYTIQNETVEDMGLPYEKPIQKSSIPNGIRIPVLMYHEISDEVHGSLDYLFVRTDSMRSQLKWLKDNGYETIVFPDLVNLSKYKKPVMLTLDDGYTGNYTNLFPLLKEFNMKATIFVVTDEIGDPYKMTEEQIRELSDSGLVSIQSHTKSHKKLSTLTDLQLIEECRESKLALRRITGVSPCAMSYPEGRYHSGTISIVEDYYDFGLLDRHGPWVTSQKTMYYIPRTVIPRSFTLQQFAAAVRR